MNVKKRHSKIGLPFKTGPVSCESSDFSDFVGEICSISALLLAKEGTNSTAFTFNVENLAVVTSAAVLLGDDVAELESACDSQLSGAVLFDIFTNNKRVCTIIQREKLQEFSYSRSACTFGSLYRKLMDVLRV